MAVRGKLPRGGPTPGDDTLTGTFGNDSISGLAGNDTLSGVGGNDTLAGNAGADTLDGGDGNDTLYSGDISPPFGFPHYEDPYTPPLLDTGTDIDTLRGGTGDDTLFAGYGDNVDGGDGVGIDHLYISFQGAPAGISFDLSLPSEVIGGGTITGIESVSWLQGSSYDDYVNLDTAPAFPYADSSFVFGMGGNDTLIAGYYTAMLDGGDGNDILDGRASQYLSQLNGGAGDDIIYGAHGWEVAFGGSGNDTIYSVHEAHGGDGNDTIFAANDGTIITGDGGDDTITGGGGNDNAQGNDGNDTLDGGGGADILDGGAGVDIISGGIADDTLTGGAGNDVFLFGQADGKDTITDFTSGDTVEVSGYTSAQSITQVGGDVVVVFSDSDQIRFSNADLATVETGLQFMPATDDTVTGGPGNDLLRGFGGNDVISGNDGYDTLAGGSGSDTLNGGAGGDTLYSGDVSPDWVAPYYGSPYTAPLLDTGSEVDTLNGGDGDDRLFAGYGDNVDGGGEQDYGDKLFISFQGAPGGVTFDGHLATQTIGGGTITGIETISWVQGSNYADHIDVGLNQENGYSDFTVVLGMAGDDTLIAGYYTALLDGGDGNDVVDGRGSAYLQEADGGSGDDIIYTDMSPNSVSNGGDGNDTIYSANETHGGAGDDTIVAGFSYYSGDLITGDAGDDHITGNAQDETIQGNDGNDTIDGGGGNDVLSGGTGIDTITGGGGADRFMYGAGDGHDTITDLQSGEIVQIDGYDSAQSMTQVGSDVLVSLSDADQITFQNTDVATVNAAIQFGPPTDDIIDGGSGDETLHGYGGSDTVSGNGGNDSVYGDDGYDTVSGGAGADYVDGGGGNDTVWSGDISPAWSMPWYNNPYTAPVLDTGAESDTVKGGAGDDVMFAGYGDNVDGGDQEYWGDKLFISFQGAPQGITFDGHLATQTIGGGTITGIEDISWVQGSNYDDYIDVGMSIDNGYSDFAAVFGMGGNDTLIAGSFTGLMDGGDGDDIVDGRNGAWEIDGGAGNDTLYTDPNLIVLANGGDGDDTIYSAGGETHGGNGNDSIVLGYSDHAVLVTGDAGDDHITGDFGVETIQGNAGNDTIDGGGGPDTISGGLGSDILTGGEGNDSFLYAIGDGKDLITDFAAGDSVNLTGYGSAQSMTQVGTDVVVALSSGDQLTFSNTDLATVEAGLHFDSTIGSGGGTPGVTLTGTSAANTLTGGTGDDTIKGMAGNDKLSGLDGNDYLLGGSGTDTILGGDGNDTIRGGLGNDVLTGGAGADAFQFEARNGSDRVTDFQSGTDKLDFHLLGIDSSSVTTSLSNGNTLVRVDANHDGRADFTVTLVGVTHVDASDYLFS